MLSKERGRMTKAKKKVFIIDDDGSPYLTEYSRMFTEIGWETVNSIKKADLIQFTGGEDVSPSLYGENSHYKTHCNPLRDRTEAIIFDIVDETKKPMAGICRGGQFLNVMCGGKLWQNVDGHCAPKGHTMYDALMKEEYIVTSTHHQMMIAGEEADILGIAYESTKLENVESLGRTKIHYVSKPHPGDTEIIVYWRMGSNVLCFQPHPEFNGNLLLKALYENYLDIIV